MDSLSSSSDSIEPRRIAGASASELGQVDDARVHLSYVALLGDPYSALRLASAYEETPSPVLLVLGDLSTGYSPVLLNVAPTPAYRLGGIFMASSGLRRSLPSPLIDGVWDDGYSELHLAAVSSR